MKPYPGMYIGKKSLNRLEGFLYGYDYALQYSEKKKFSIVKEKSEFEKFRDFTAGYYDTNLTTISYFDHINKNNNNDEKAVDEFYRLLDVFWSLKPEVYYSRTLTRTNKNIDIVYEQARKRETVISYGYNTAQEVMEEILVGFIFRQKEINLNFTSPYFEFNQFIIDKYDENPNLRWPDIINKQLGIMGNPLKNLVEQDRKSIQLFYELLDEFYGV